MNRRSTWLLTVVATMVAMAPLSGCLFAADLLNPATAASLGFTINNPVGSVVVVFKNDTDQPAIFFAFQQNDTTQVNTARGFQVGVDPNSDSNEVMNCPTGRISLGAPQADGTVAGDQSAAVGATVVAYTGDAVREGVDYQCGDVIVYRVSVRPGGDPASDFVITASVRPGG